MSKLDRDKDEQVWSQIALALSPQAPPPQVRERLMLRVTGPERYALFAAELAEMFDLQVERMHELLTRATDPDTYRDALVPGLRFSHFPAGPRVGDRHAGFARLVEGFEIPVHRHVHEDLTFVLEGLLVENDGTIYGPGELIRKAPGSVHSLSVVTAAVVALLSGGVAPPG